LISDEMRSYKEIEKMTERICDRRKSSPARRLWVLEAMET
jgi:hypothetical protein